jgi:magnesium chelatase family protein
VEVPRPDTLVLYTQGARSENSATVRERVVTARNIQLKRAGVPNALLCEQAFRTHCRLEPDGRELLETASKKLALSPRACQRIMKVARTLADLEGAVSIGIGQLAEAVAFRRLGAESDTPLSRLNLH